MYFVHSTLGGVHLAFSILALIVGTIVLIQRKGTKFHKQVGYVYAASMVGVCGTAFGLYNLTGKFGVFHIAAIVSTLTLLGGMLPLMIKSIPKKYKPAHMWFMYYSVLGLYAAFASELSVRIPETPFFGMVGIATFLIFGIGMYFIRKKEAVWTAHFS